MGTMRVRFLLAVLFSLAIFLLSEGTAFSAQISGLTSPTHPDPNQIYPNNNPVFVWDRVPAPLGGFFAYDTTGTARSMEVSGNYAFVADGTSGLQILGISDVGNVALLRTVDTPGDAYDVSISGDMAFIADGQNGIAVVDITEPGNAAYARSFGASTYSLESVGDRLYVYFGTNITIYDISDPGNEVMVGQLPGSLSDFHVEGNLMFVTRSNAPDMQIYDVSDPANAVLLSSFTVPGEGCSGMSGEYFSAFRVSASGDMAYLAYQALIFGDDCPQAEIIGIVGQDVRLLAFDISDPTQPEVIGQSSVQGEWASVSDVSVINNHVYVAGGGSGMFLFDVSDKSKPEKVGHFKDPGNAYIYAATGSGGYAYLAAGGGGLIVVDTVNIIPVQYSYVLDKNYSSVPDSTPEGNDISAKYYNLHDGTYYFHVAAIENGSVSYTYHQRVRIGVYCGQRPDTRVRNPRSYWASFNEYMARRLSVEYDLTNFGQGPAFNTKVNGFTAGSGVTRCATMNCDTPLIEVIGEAAQIPGSSKTITRNVAVRDQYAYVCTNFGELAVFDISDPVAPAFMGKSPSSTGSGSVALSGDYAFLANTYGLLIVNISDPHNPTNISMIDTPGYSYDVVLDGINAFIADGSGGLQVLDVSDPANPTLIGAVALPHSTKGVAVQGDYAYVASSFAGFFILDISNPVSPVIVGTVDTPGQALRVAISGDYAYVADEGAGLQVIDVSDKTNPAIVGSYNSPGEAYDVAVGSERAYLADGRSGLQVLDVSNPTQPVLLGKHVGVIDYFTARDLALSGNDVIVAGNKPLTIFRGVYGDEPFFPISIGNIDPGEMSSFTVWFDIPHGVYSFNTSFTGSAGDACGNSYSYGS